MRLKLNESLNEKESLHLPQLKPAKRNTNPYQGIKNITRSVIDRRTDPVTAQKRALPKNSSALGSKDIELNSGVPVKSIFLTHDEQKTYGDRSPKGYQKLRLLGK